jgi:hydroxymethylbilane synthase
MPEKSQEPQPIRIATRGSALARAQAEWVAAALAREHPGLRVALEIIETTGDRLAASDAKPAESTKEIFTKEIEEALLDGRADIAVHSCKDLPVTLADGLVLAAVPPREDPRDVLVLKEAKGLSDIPEGTVILTSSDRRKLQWLENHPNTRVQPIRGNIDTRLRRLREAEGCAGLLLAKAGLNRLKLDCAGLVTAPLSPFEMIPAGGQGALAIEVRADDESVAKLAAPLNDPECSRAVACERAFLREMDAGCRSPIGVFAVPASEDSLEATAIYYATDNDRPCRAQLSGPAADPEALGRSLAGRIRGEQ